MHSELCIHPSHNFLNNAYPLQFCQPLSENIYSGNYAERKRQAHAAGALVQCYGSLIMFLFNIVQSSVMSDTGFTCPKCDHSFPTAEQVAEHLRNEHVDGTQTESTKRMT